MIDPAGVTAGARHLGHRSQPRRRRFVLQRHDCLELALAAKGVFTPGVFSARSSVLGKRPLLWAACDLLRAVTRYVLLLPQDLGAAGKGS